MSGDACAGRTTVVANLAVALGERGRDVVLIDTASRRPRLHAALGLTSRGDLGPVLSGTRSIDEVLMPCAPRVYLVPGFAASDGNGTLGVMEQAATIWSVDTLRQHVDTLLLDTDDGAGADLAIPVRAAHYVIVVVRDENSSKRGTLALIEYLSREYGIRRFKVLANATARPVAGLALYHELRQFCDRSFDVVLEYIGAIPHDVGIARSRQTCPSSAESDPRSDTTGAFQCLAAQVESWPAPRCARGQMEFFAARLMNADNRGSTTEWPSTH